jgi:hypothetical protein
MRALIFLSVIFSFSGCALLFDAQIASLLREQGLRNEAAKPFLDAAIVKKLKIGDTAEHAKKVLRDAGLDFYQEALPTPRLLSTYRTGDGCGFSIAVNLDRKHRVAKIDIREFFTGP